MSARIDPTPPPDDDARALAAVFRLLAARGRAMRNESNTPIDAEPLAGCESTGASATDSNESIAGRIPRNGESE